MIYFQRTILPWTLICLMGLSMLALWGNFFRDRRLTDEQVQEANQPESPLLVLAERLEIPWDLAFLPDGDLLVAERPGRLVRIGAFPSSYHLSEVVSIGEAGLLGIALHPDFDQNQWIYLFYTTKNNETIVNSVVKYKLTERELKKERTILSQIPAAAFHNGGKMVFGPEGGLYVATGDAGNSSLAQDLQSLAGKILRMDAEGRHLEVYSFGHRNPLGLSWDEEGNLWASEAGAQGQDKIHLILQGSNYGWPKGKIIRAAAIDSPQNAPWGLGQIACGNGHLYAAGLHGQALYDIDLTLHPLEPETHLHERFGRLRGIAFGPDGFLYLTTNNRDGRGQPHVNDDKVIRIHPNSL